MKLNLPRRAKKRVFTRERMPLLAPTDINQMWALDFMHDTLYDGRKFRLLNVIDEANREALRMECGNSFRYLPHASFCLFDNSRFISCVSEYVSSQMHNKL